ncbi:NUDIX domain-containing protein [Roseovarius nanhaiticus]|uniref:NUDIX domain-containing protein n=1 Tax=Roseovarius nanhaiticus TaxID=573024 RepID=UPI0009F9879A|nr:NUDIX domain-containing protein [Roseovarius nanhaiticus]
MRCSGGGSVKTLELSRVEDIFLYGTLRDTELRNIVLGAEAPVIQAILPDHAVFWAEGQIYPTIVNQSGAAAPGLLLNAPDAALLARLDFYEGGFGYDLAPVEVRDHAGMPRPARVYFPRPGAVPPGAPFDLGDWQDRHGALSRTAAQEAMGYLGRLDADTLAARMPMIRARASARLSAAEGVPARIRSDTPSRAVETLETEVNHIGFYRFETQRLRHPTFASGADQQVRREMVVATDAVMVLPYDPVRDRVLMVEQFRMGAYGRGDPRPWMLEPVAGRIDAGETPEEAARRECEEEAGIALSALEPIASYYCTPGYSTEYFHNFVGLADLPDDLPRLGGLASEAEDIRIHLIGFADAMRLIETGEADNGPLILSLLWLARERATLRRTP